MLRVASSRETGWSCCGPCFICRECSLRSRLIGDCGLSPSMSGESSFGFSAALAGQAQSVAASPASLSVTIHIPWERVDDSEDLVKHAQSVGLEIGAVNPNVFQEYEYKLGSVCNPALRFACARSRTYWSASKWRRQPVRPSSACGLLTARTTRAGTASSDARTAWPRLSPLCTRLCPSV